MIDKTQRRLAAILAADVAGYTRLVELDTDGTVAAWTSARDNMIKPLIDKNSGHIIKFTGDGFLVEFPSVQNAVVCAITLQEELRSSSLNFRIGINVGDITDDGSDVHGEGVNIAARLEALAEPGGICISGDVYNQVRNRIDAVFTDMGEQEVKHVSQPVSVFAINPTERKTSDHLTPPAPALPDKPSIAVLPFDNMSGDPEQEYFSDGITEDIITALSRSPWLFIIARNTTFTFKGKKIDVKRMAKELGVRYVLEGSVRRAGDRVRVTAQLIDGTTGGHIWSERYDGHLADVFDLQDEITQNVVASIQTKVHLTAGQPVESSKRPNLTVWELTMRAWKLVYDFSSESYATAKTLLDEAITLDPNSTEAHLILAVIHYHDAIMGLVKDKETSLALSRQLALRAVRLDDQNEYAHWALGLSCLALARHEESITVLERAIELNPNCSVAYGSLGTALNLVGRVDEAIVNHEIAIRSNPRDPSIFFRFTGISLAHFLAGRYDDAIEWANKAVHRMPTWYLGHFLLAASYIQANNLLKAKTAVDQCREVLPDASVSQLRRLPLKNAIEMNQFRECLLKAGLPE
jgi:TolB-like protein/Tfp pilus assembly protein PilF